MPFGAQSDPKALQNRAPGDHFNAFSYDMATLHPIQYLQWFWYILKVSGHLFFANFLAKMGVGHKLQSKSFWERLLVIFIRKCTKMGTQMARGRSPQNTSFFHWATFGVPWEPKATKMEPNGANMTHGDPKIEV